MTVELTEMVVCADVPDQDIFALLVELFALDRSRVMDLSNFWDSVSSMGRVLGVEVVRRVEGYRLLVKIYSNFPLQETGRGANEFAVRFSTVAAIGDEAGNEDSVLIFYEDGSYSKGLDVGGAGEGEFSARGHRGIFGVSGGK